ncbi:MAG: LytTR family DNA-binding domain-containing protein [Rikenellaceae bacterium]|nr:LytTR family DNA-binding domain-containing protein [Rikenellaceae bacterium]
MNVLIVEDETIASEYLSNLLTKVYPQIVIAGTTESVEQTVKWLQNNQSPDLIFMDIHLSDGSAFSIFEAVKIETPVIFTTAYDEYAIKAFKVNSIDYLLKPIDEIEMRRALEKFRNLTYLQKTEYVAHQSESNLSGNYHKKLLVSYRDNLLPVSVEDISYFYTTAPQTTLCLEDGRKFAYNKSLDSIIQGLDPELFFRANKQFIISREHVSQITVWFDRRLLVTLKNEAPERIYISKNRSGDFKEWLMGSKK